MFGKHATAKQPPGVCNVGISDTALTGRILHLPSRSSSKATMDSRRPSTHTRSFGTQEPLSEDVNPTPSTAHRILGRISFSSLRRGRPSFLNSGNGDSPSTPSTERPPIPTMMNGSGEAYMTPLPKLSMVVLSIVSSISSLFV